MMSTPVDYEDMVGKIVPKSYLAGYIVLSYLFSYIGSWTTLEMLYRGTSIKGFHNWLLLSGSSITIGGIAVWGTYFIGKRGVILGDGSMALQISYVPGFTALSFFAPILLFLVAFCVVESGESASIIRSVIGAILGTLGVFAMYYSGQAAVANYVCVYSVPYVVGAAVVLVVAFMAALFIFLLVKSSWDTSWWSRGLCAIIIAVAITTSNWLISVGTKFRFKEVNSSAPVLTYKNATIVSVFVLFTLGCFALVALTTLAHRRLQYAMQECQQIALAVAIFDREGKIMVTPEGRLPTRRVADEYYEKTIYDIFGTRHPLFLWVFRASHYWLGIASLIPAMRRHLRANGLQAHRISSRISLRSKTHSGFKLLKDCGEPIDNYTIVFRELFCVAAAEIAADLRRPIESLGIIFDEVMPTGQSLYEYPKLSWFRWSPKVLALPEDVENSVTPIIGRGQLLFLVNSAQANDSTILQANGYRFAPVSNVITMLSRTMQVPKSHLESYMRKMSKYASEPIVREPGVYVACFAIRASIKTGFDVVVRKDVRHLIPSIPLPMPILDEWQVAYLRTFESYPLPRLYNYLNRVTLASNAPPDERVFSAHLVEAIGRLKALFSDVIINEAVLMAEPFKAPCRGSAEQLGEATLIAFRLIIPIHTRRAPGINLLYWPLNLFKTQQRVYKNSPDHLRFARRAYRELAPVIGIDENTMSPDEGRSQRRFSRRMMFGSGRLSLHEEVELGHDTDAEGNVTRQSLHPTASGLRHKCAFWRQNSNPRRGHTKSENDIAHELDTVETTHEEALPTIREAADSRSHSRDEEDVFRPRIPIQAPTDDIQRLHNKTKTGQVSLVAKEDIEPITFVDLMFAKCVEKKFRRPGDVSSKQSMKDISL